jgi:hypothetical protein
MCHLKPGLVSLCGSTLAYVFLAAPLTSRVLDDLPLYLVIKLGICPCILTAFGPVRDYLPLFCPFSDYLTLYYG